jgi:hypothetical protein
MTSDLCDKRRKSKTFSAWAGLALCLFLLSHHAGADNAPMPPPQLQFLDANGSPLAGGCVFTYNAGTTTPALTYQDSSSATPNTNPVILDAGGRANIWLGRQKYRIKVMSSGGTNCASGAQQYIVDNISATNLPPDYVIVADPANNAPQSISGPISLGSFGLTAGSVTAAITATSLNGVVMVPDSGSLNAAAASTTCAAGNCSIFVTRDVTLSNTLNIGTGQPNVTIQCFNGATIRRTSPFSITAAGDSFTLRDCILDGGSLSTMAQALVLNGANAHVEHNTFQNYSGTGGSSGSGIVVASDTSNTRITNNRFLRKTVSLADVPILLTNNIDHAVISGNFIDLGGSTTGISAIELRSSQAGKIVQNVVVSNNDIRAQGWCVVVGPGGAGIKPTNVTVTGNECFQSAASSGGYEISADSSTLTGNSYYAPTSATSQACIFAFISSYITVTGNACTLSNLGNGIQLDRVSFSTVTANTISGFRPTATDWGILLSANGTNPTSNGNIISNNTINFPTSGAGKGIWLQCNFAGCSNRDNVVSNNQITGQNQPGAIGVFLDSSLGTIDATQVTDNLIFNVDTAYNFSANTTNTLLRMGQLRQVNTNLVLAGTLQSINVAGGMVSDGQGFKQLRFGATCATAAAAGSTCTSTYTYTTAFVDANHTPVCWGVGPTGTPILSANAAPSATQVVVKVTAATAAASSFANVYCVDPHD